MKKILFSLFFISNAFASHNLILTKEIKSLLGSCNNFFSQPEIDINTLDSSEKSAEFIKNVLLQKKISEQFSSPPLLGVGVIITNDEGKVLLAKRKGSHGSGQWAISGGHVEDGEKIFDAAKREVLEEIGVELKDLEFFGIALEYYPFSGKTYFDFFITAKIKSGVPQVMEPHKVASDWLWFGHNELPEPLFLPLTKLIEYGYIPGEDSKLSKERIKKLDFFIKNKKLFPQTLIIEAANYDLEKKKGLSFTAKFTRKEKIVFETILEDLKKIDRILQNIEGSEAGNLLYAQEIILADYKFIRTSYMGKQIISITHEKAKFHWIIQVTRRGFKHLNTNGSLDDIFKALKVTKELFPKR